MTELELQQYLLREYPQENARCEWKEFKNLNNSFCGNEKDDVITYVSAIANIWEDILCLELTIRRLKLSGLTFQGLPLMGNRQIHSLQLSNLQKVAKFSERQNQNAQLTPLYIFVCLASTLSRFSAWATHCKCMKFFNQKNFFANIFF